MDEGLVTPSETTAVVLKSRRGHGRIAEPWMAFNFRRFSLLNIASCGCKSIVETLPGYLWKLRGWRWLDIYRVWMRTSSQKDGQQQRRQSKPFLHVISSIVGFVVPPMLSATLPDVNP
jgi:hypothetical protein